MFLKKIAIHRRLQHFICSVLLAAAFAGCEEVITIDLEEGPERLVVEGRIERIKEKQSSYQEILLSMTDAFFSDSSTPKVSGALVTVSDELGNTTTFAESEAEPGRYVTNELQAEIGRTYTLTIQFAGDTYEARATLLAVAAIDSIYQRFVENHRPGDEGEDGLRVFIDYTDIAGVENYYLWEQFVDGVSQMEATADDNQFHLISKDQFYDGQKIVAGNPYERSVVEPGQEVLLRQISLSAFAYDYYFLLFDQAGGGRVIFDTPSAPIKGNIENVTDPERYPLGYFGASEVSQAEILIQEEN